MRFQSMAACMMCLTVDSSTGRYLVNHQSTICILSLWPACLALWRNRSMRNSSLSLDHSRVRRWSSRRTALPSSSAGAFLSTTFSRVQSSAAESTKMLESCQLRTRSVNDCCYRERKSAGRLRRKTHVLGSKRHNGFFRSGGWPVTEMHPSHFKPMVYD